LEGASLEAVLDEEACVAAAFHAANSGDAERLSVLRGSRGGRNLIALGYEADIELAARVDTCGLVPEYDPLAGALVARTSAADGGSGREGRRETASDPLTTDN
ncbi:MAG: hypothetical protein WD066_10985, partial [Planctomycetaceae bacterium]